MKFALPLTLCLCSGVLRSGVLRAEENGIFDQPHLTVSGTGEVDAKPDMATITVGVVTVAVSAAGQSEMLVQK